MNRSKTPTTALLLSAAFILLLSPIATATPAGPDHVVIVVMENKFRSEVVGNAAAPYENALAASGVDYANMQGKTHPSLPNYLDLYSGSTQGQDGKDVCVRLSTTNLGLNAANAGVSLKVYAEDLGTGSPTSDHGTYVCRHNPAAQFTDAANAAASVDFATGFPTDYTQLPKVSFVIPNICNDTHDCSVGAGDLWLKNHIDGYVQWAKTHNSVLVLTWDENDSGTDYTTPMPTLIVGAGVAHSVPTTRVSEENILRTVEDWYGLPLLGGSASAAPMPGLPAYPIGSTTPAPTPAPTGTFVATFTPSANVNAWWVEVKVTSASTVASVAATVNGGSPHNLPKDSWGTWAASFSVPAGSQVVFTAKDTAGNLATSGTYTWLMSTVTTTTTTTTTTAFTATFGPKAIGNDWWLETSVAANQPIAKVQARVNGGAAVDLPKDSWGTYAKSVYAPNGSQVVFIATSTSGATASSPTVTWT